MIEECYSLPDDIKYHYKNIEKCFFKAFNLVEPLFTGQTNKVNSPNINPQVLNEIIFELDNELSPRHPIYIGTEQKYYDLLLWSKIYRTVFYADKSTFNYSYEANSTISDELHSIASSLLTFDGLYETLSNEEENEYLQILARNGIKDIKSIKILKFISSEEAKKTVVDVLDKLYFQFDLNKYIKTPIFDKFLSTIPNSVSFEISLPMKSGYNFVKRMIEIDSPDTRKEYLITPFKFSEEPSIGTDRYIAEISAELDRLRTLFHEGCHAICDGFFGIISILNDRANLKDEITPALDTCLHIFNKIEMKVKPEVYKLLNQFQTPDSDDCDGFYQYMLEECPSTNINLNFVPKNFDEIPQFLEHCTSRPAAARLLFFYDREVFQQFGFIIHDGVMYVNKIV